MKPSERPMTETERKLLDAIQVGWDDECILADERKNIDELAKRLQVERLPQELRQQLRVAYRECWLADRRLEFLETGVPEALMRKLRAEWLRDLKGECDETE